VAVAEAEVWRAHRVEHDDDDDATGDHELSSPGAGHVVSLH
jgi:hypothetical protein